MIFNSINYLMFFPIVVLMFYLVPRKIRYIWLVFSSYFFYMCIHPKYAILLFFSTLLTYLTGLILEKATRKKRFLIACIVANLGLLFFFKYFQWIFEQANQLFGRNDSLPFQIILPIGISFYTFQTIGYVIDVYRGDKKAEKNFLKYALFVSFFPLILAGPIERSRKLLVQVEKMHESKRIDFETIRSGLCLMLWGFFIKLVIADRAIIYVNYSFDHYSELGFRNLAVGAILFALQIYCDFHGYTTIARGSALVLGFDLMDNFKQPYFANSIREFWKRWHISLTSWFTDYLYIPLGGNRKGYVRQLVNILIVFIVSGLWHGASWHFVAWGILHGIFQIVSNLTIKSGLIKKSESRITHFLGIVLTFIMVDFAWIFFRANGLKDAVGYIVNMVSDFQSSASQEILGESNWFILLIAVIVLLVVDYLHEKNIKIRDYVFKQKIVLRWSIYIVAIWFIILFGVYGVAYDTSQFIYFQF